jgi:hypothetical protein
MLFGFTSSFKKFVGHSKTAYQLLYLFIADQVGKLIVKRAEIRNRYIFGLRQGEVWETPGFRWSETQRDSTATIIVSRHAPSFALLALTVPLGTPHSQNGHSGGKRWTNTLAPDGNRTSVPLYIINGHMWRDGLWSPERLYFIQEELVYNGNFPLQENL